MTDETIGNAINPKERICKNCKHFRQHYIKLKRGSYTEVDGGHCVKPLCKPRKSSTKACNYFEERENA